MFSEKERISPRQLMMLMVLALLPVESHALPGRMAEAAGSASWLSPLIAILPTLALAPVLLRLVSPAPGTWRGLDEAYCAALGPALGGVVNGVYLAWVFILICDIVRLYGERFLVTTYAGTPPALFFAILLALCIWVARGKLDALARVNQIFFYILLACVLAILLFAAAADLDLNNVFPVWTYDLPRAARGSLSACSGISLAAYLTYLCGGIGGEPAKRGPAMLWLAGACLLAAALQFALLGVFGAGVIARVQMPFFELAKQVSVFGAFGRFESVIVSLWVLTDLVLVSSLMLVCCVILHRMCGMRDGRAAVIPLAFLALTGAWLIAGDVFVLERFARQIIQPVNLFLGYLVPAAALIVGRLRKRI